MRPQGDASTAARDRFSSRLLTRELPGEWVLWTTLHRWKDRDGCRWQMQLWHPAKRGFIVSARGIVR